MNQVEFKITDKLGLPEEAIEKLKEYALNIANEDRIRDGKGYYDIENPYGRFKRSHIKIWASDTENFFKLLDIRDGYQQFLDYDHKIKLNNGLAFRFDIDIDKI